MSQNEHYTEEKLMAKIEHIWPDHNARFRRSAIVRPVTFNMLSESVTRQLGDESGNVEP